MRIRLLKQPLTIGHFEKYRLGACLTALVCSLCVYFSYLASPSWIGAVLGWISGVALVMTCRSAHGRYWPLYLGGAALNAVSFSWLTYTISVFGGFGFVSTLLLYSAFVLYSALQFPLFFFLWKNLPPLLTRLALRTPLAWTAVEILPLRIFPWHLGHSQLGFLPLVQVADLGGSPLVSFLMLWCCEAALLAAFTWKKAAHKTRPHLLQSALPFAFLAIATFYGILRIEQFRTPQGRVQEAAIIQGNVPLEEKHDADMYLPNIARYLRLTEQVNKAGLLVIWPESAVHEFIFSGVRSSANDSRLPSMENNPHFLIGALTFDERQNLYNSALAIYADGYVPEPYHKQILMPFGEYTPLAKTFPWIGKLNSNTLDLTPGREVKVFSYPAQTEQGFEIRVAPLICYEDLIPGLAQEAVKKGAELLVNLTNDAWYGRSAAMYHHNLIASFRAIENRRFLLRATNTGLTTIINPIGETVSQLEPFTEGSILARVNLISYKTLYTRFAGGRIWWVVFIFCCLAVLYRKFLETRN